jgi:two-component system, NtrC family, response regulator HydG
VLEGENRRVGSAAVAAVNVRVIAATHRDLAELTAEGQFRQDLFYRLNVVSFNLPTLHQRREDILEIADWLLGRTSKRLNKEGLSFSADARAAMQQYHWPGNVRELENAVERAVILADNHSELTQASLAIQPVTQSRPEPEFNPEGDQTSLEDYFVRFVLDHQDQFTETELAEKLGISRKSLWERRQRLSIPRRKTRKRGPRRDSANS